MTTKSLFAAFECQVARTPDSPALEHGDKILSYRELLLLVEQTANALRAKGVQAGTKVGLLLPRSWQLVVATLAVLRCGATAVPLDRNSPTARLQMMISTVDCSLVIGQEGVCLEVDKYLSFDDISASASESKLPDLTFDPQTPAFVFFTSGSTGIPKAVLVPDMAVLRLGQEGYIPFETGMRFGSISNPSFDAFNFDIWAPLLTGGVCVIVDPHILMDFQKTAEFLRISKIDTVFLTTTLFNAFTNEVECCFDSLKAVLVGGERISTPTVLSWYAKNPDSDCIIYNVYGPTECATFSICYPIPRNETRKDAPIGHPLPGTEIHIDADTGELWIGGDAVGLGYHGLPEATKASFLHRNDGVFYKTGDLVSRNTDGTINFVGRLGRQTKVRGFRVEPGEIENLLESHHYVAQSYVCVIKKPDRPTQLHAYVKFKNDIDYHDFQSFMRATLPSYMLPHRLFRVSHFPTTPNGKIDMTALQAAQTSPWTARTSVQNDTQLTTPLLTIAQEVLEHSDLTEEDSFFDGGGDSLSALTFKHRFEKETGQILDLQDILALPFKALASTARHSLDTTPHIGTNTDKQALATSEQRRLWLDAQRNPESCAYSVPLIYRLDGKIDVEKLARAFQDTFAAHQVFSTAFSDAQDGLWQIVRPETECRFHDCSGGQITESNYQEKIHKIFRQPFDLNNAALCQAYWFPFDSQSGVLVIHAHHIILDGWSLNLFLKEISERYAGSHKKSKPALTMTAFSEWQRQAHNQKSYKSDLQALCDLWKEQKARDPFLKPRVIKEQKTAKVVRRPLTQEQLDTLSQLSQDLKITKFRVLMMVCAWAFSAVTGRQRFTVASPVSNRALLATGDMIGMLANTALFPVDLCPDQTPLECFADQQGKWSKVLELEHIALEHLYEEMTARKAQDSLHYDCMFVMENTDYDTFELSGAKASFHYPKTVEPKAPITAFVAKTPSGAELVAEIDQSYFRPADADRFITAFFEGLRAFSKPVQIGDTLIRPKNQSGPKTKLQYKTVAETLRAQALATPNAIALRLGDRTMSYQEMMQRANALSETLMARLNGKPSATVALYMTASIEHIISIIALAQINATILPLDPEFPDSMLERIVGAGQPDLILGQTSTQRSTIAETEITPISIDATLDHFKAIYNGNPLYVLFTSGSTGDPKGVRVWDDTICNLLQWQRDFGGLGAAANTQQFSKLSFDVSFQEILTTLTTGGTLSLLLPGLRRDPEKLLQKMQEERCERIFLPFVALKLLAETALSQKISLPDMRQVISAGEALLCTSDLRDWFQTMPDARLINHYGPTETHVICAHALQPNTSDWPEVAPIGHPVSNCDFDLDKATNELLVSGPHIRPCYLDESHNKTRFSGRNPSKYHTGDRVALLRNDRFVTFGRTDDQIKLSGHRIERQEIEAVINRHPNVALCLLNVTKNNQVHAYIEAKGTAPNLESLNSHIGTVLPDYVRLSDIFLVAEWPKTRSGKIDRQALLQKKIPKQADQSIGNSNTTVEQLIDIFKETLGREIAPDQTFWAAGATSLELIRFRNAVQNSFSAHISVSDLFGQATTLVKLANFLKPVKRDLPESISPVTEKCDKFAIVGMAIDLPGAANLSQFKAMILGNQCGVEHFETSTSKIGARSQMQQPLGFDPSYFDISRQEAILMDPQQRQLLMNAVHVLADAGLDPARTPARIGIIASCGENTYFQQMLRDGDPENLPDGFQMALHHDKDFLATKLAYRLGLTGPALTVQAACGSSLIGVHTATSLLRDGACDVMLVGASLIDPTLKDGYTYRPHHIFSKDGFCRPFDAEASGTIGASGVGFVAIAPLQTALDNGYRVHAILEGSAINNDGRDKMSYTAPSTIGQQAVLQQALNSAGLEGKDVTYIEAHGTGTQLGDPVEIEAIDKVYGGRNDLLFVSSVKSQLGHLGAAAGLIGLIRVALAIKLRVIPPNLHFEKANPELNLNGRQIAIPARTQPWPAKTRYAGVSSFGIGGTNAHAIVGQFDQAKSDTKSDLPVLLISAHNEHSLQIWAQQIADYLEKYPDQAKAVQYFLAFGARVHECRAGFVWTDLNDAIAKLRNLKGHTIKQNDTCFSLNDSAPTQMIAQWMDGAQPKRRDVASPAPSDFPPYQFEIATFDFQRKVAKTASSGARQRLDSTEWLSQPVWVPLGVPPMQEDRADKTAIVVCCPEQTELPITGYKRVIHLRVSDQAAQQDADNFTVRLNPQNFKEIAEGLSCDAVDILNLLPLSIPPGLHSNNHPIAQMACLDVMPCLVALAHALGAQPTRILHVSNDASCAANGKIKSPLANLLAGATQVIPTEADIPTHWLDLSNKDTAGLNSCLHARELPLGRIAWAHDQLWVRNIVKTSANFKSPLTSRPVRWVVVGGTGGIGRNLCQTLLKDTKNHVEIVSRDPHLPSNLTAYAERVTLHQIDLTDQNITWPDFPDPVYGIIFAAGIGSYAPVAGRDADKMHTLNALKINGAEALERLIVREQPDRVIYCSSMSSELGGKGQLDYAATNGLLDGLSYWRNPKAPDVRRLTINWDIWSESGMALDGMTNDALHQEHLTYGLTNAEAQAIFNDAVACTSPQLLVSTLPLDQARYFYGSELNKAPQKNAKDALHVITSFVAEKTGETDIPPDVPLSDLGIDSIDWIDLIEQISSSFNQTLNLSAFSQDETISNLVSLIDKSDSEQTDSQKLCAIFSDELGVEEVRTDQSFFDLGIDSLLAIDLIGSIETQFKVALSISDFEEDQDINALLPKIFGKKKSDHEKLAVQVDQWQQGDGPHSICFIHPIGGETACYRPLLSAIEDSVSVFAIADPNLYLSTPESQPIKERAAAYLAALKQVVGLGTVRLVGWSFGAWVAQEMAVQAEAEQNPVIHVTMIDPPDPECGSRIGTPTYAEIQTAFLEELEPQLSQRGAGNGISAEVKNHLDKLTSCCALNIESMKAHTLSPLEATHACVFIAENAAKGLLVKQIDSDKHLKKWRNLLRHLQQAKTVAADHYSIIKSPIVDKVIPLCLSLPILCHYLLATGILGHGTETIFG